MAWPWSLPACGISGIDLLFVISIVIVTLMPGSAAEPIYSGQDIQASIDSANAGDTIIVGPGEYSPFEVDKPLTILGEGSPIIKSAIQRPGITIEADDVSVSGFLIDGVNKDSQSKYEYYMNNPSAAYGQRLNLPNSAVMINADRAHLAGLTVFGAEVGIWAESGREIDLLNSSFESCKRGLSLSDCLSCRVEKCSFYNCDTAGIEVTYSREMAFSNNTIVNTTNAGLLLKESEDCIVFNNSFSWNREGLFLWNSSRNEIRNNSADHNYYAITLSGSDNNSVLENQVYENSRNEIISGFGIGISLQENSTYNVIAKNTAKENFNGLEMTRGCRLNTVFANVISQNKHGIRLDKNYNNLVFGNNFVRNTISAYDNSSNNYWNTTIGNYYSDYRGKDENGDGIGDSPYPIPMGDHDESDVRPLMKPYQAGDLNMTELRAEVQKYASFVPVDTRPMKVEGGTIVISSPRPTSPPTWSDSPPLIQTI
jgi:nitrous oxidase accessory protein